MRGGWGLLLPTAGRKSLPDKIIALLRNLLLTDSGCLHICRFTEGDAASSEWVFPWSPTETGSRSPECNSRGGIVVRLFLSGGSLTL